MGGRSCCVDECYEGDESGIGNSEVCVGVWEVVVVEEKESNGWCCGCNIVFIMEKMKWRMDVFLSDVLEWY